MIIDSAYQDSLSWSHLLRSIDPIEKYLTSHPNPDPRRYLQASLVQPHPIAARQHPGPAATPTIAGAKAEHPRAQALGQRGLNAAALVNQQAAKVLSAAGVGREAGGVWERVIGGRDRGTRTGHD